MIPPPDHGPQARKIVEWQHDQAQLQHDVIGIGDVQSDTVYGRLLVRSLTRAHAFVLSEERVMLVGTGVPNAAGRADHGVLPSFEERGFR